MNKLSKNEYSESEIKSLSTDELALLEDDLEKKIRVKQYEIQKYEKILAKPTASQLPKFKQKDLKVTPMQTMKSNKIKEFTNKYLPDILIQIGLFILISNGGLRSIFTKVDSDAAPFASLVFIGLNIAIRRYLESKER